MGPPQDRAEGKENLPDLLATLLLMHPRIPLPFLAPRAPPLRQLGLVTGLRARAVVLSPPSHRCLAAHRESGWAISLPHPWVPCRCPRTVLGVPVSKLSGFLRADVSWVWLESKVLGLMGGAAATAWLGDGSGSWRWASRAWSGSGRDGSSGWGWGWAFPSDPAEATEARVRGGKAVGCSFCRGVCF